MPALYQKQLVEMEAKYNKRLDQDSLALQNGRIELTQAQLKQKNFLLTSALLLAGIVVLLAMYFYNKRKQAEQLRKVEENLRMAEQEKRVAEEEKRKQEEEARKSVESAYKDADHRIRNTLARIDFIVGESKAKTTDQASIATIEERIKPLTILYDMLGQTPAPDVSLQQYFETICHNLRQSYAGHRQIEIKVNAHEAISGKKAGTLGLIVNEIVTNSFKYAFAGKESGTIAVDLQGKNGQHVLRVADNGTGITTASNAGSGIEIVKDLAHELRAGVKQYNDDGANFEIIFL